MEVIDCSVELQIEANGIYIGGIGGNGDAFCEIRRSCYKGEIYSSNSCLLYVGVFLGVGYNNPIIKNCYCIADLKQGMNYYIGGLIGYLSSGINLENSYFVGDVEGSSSSALIGYISDTSVECHIEYIDIEPDFDFKLSIEKTTLKIITEATTFDTKIPEDYYDEEDLTGNFTVLSYLKSYYIRAVAVINKDKDNEKKYYSEVHKIPRKNNDEFRNESFVSAPDLKTDMQLRQRGKEILMEKNQTINFDIEYNPRKEKSKSEDNVELTVNNTVNYLQDFKVGDVVYIIEDGLVEAKMRLIEVKEEKEGNNNLLELDLGREWPDLINIVKSKEKKGQAIIRK